MAQFQYKAVGPDGTVARGQMEAPDRAAAAARLQSQGHLPLTLEAFEPARGVRALLSMEIGKGRHRGPRLATDLVCRLALLLQAGVALEIALALLSGSEGRGPLRDVAAGLLQKLRGGASLSASMSDRPDIFSPVVVAMVRAGESSGALGPTLERLADHLARAESVRQSIQSALIYPAVLLATAIGAVLLILLVVLPQLQPVFVEAGNRLPVLTRLAFAASVLVRQFWWLGLAIIFAMALLSHRLLQNPIFRVRRDAWLLRLPVVGLAVRRAEAGRFVRVLGTLVGGGVALPAALPLARPVLANRVVADAIEGVIKAVREGDSLARPLSQINIFPDLAVQMIQIGETTGRLDAMLLRLADLLEAEVQTTLNRAVSLLVPVLTICLGGMVAAIIASVMLAVLGINDLLH
ncbi:type II secretion system F family protein [Bradyrhizobium sp.]|uniref:type II secretion system F family protein n=1 Tax=Bradyrhizobium sp. TaxID=376 RepID=UPI001DF837B6|nr:type II secretion system F family protein [Bradyrhizobium sp.]MBI5321170.1 type II secretion system F family protein [Bradyrhizobium sp.]